MTEWGTAPGPDPRSADGPSALDIRSVELAKAFVWAEHCIECAIPDCYAVCPLYVARRDKKCARFTYGIYANPKFAGLLDRGADVHFRRWGRLEAPIAAGAASPRRLRQLAKLDRAAVSAVNRVAAALEPIDPKRRLNGVYRILANEGLARSTRRSSNGASRFDDFVVEVFNPNLESVNLIVEVQHDRPVFRTSFLLEPGANLHRIPVADMNGALDSGVGRLLVYPENDAEVRLIFRWLDLVRYTPAMRARLSDDSTGGIAIAVPSADRPTSPPATGASAAPAAPTSPVEPAAKVKCVAWDLDNTVWSGVLVEDGPAALTVRPGVVELIRQLDERGILNTIVSKNDHDPAWAKVTELELAEYFVSPAINWGPKSASLRAVAEVLNINLDTFVLIDDQAFERAEVASELPQVRVVADTEIDA
ncbi:MAG TPA: HAD-IIIC family phosphatase, partial [Candidatus Deferrimicrobium sp.]|nr:HAD-IIIC family phosphatase [Candidatus Deferrimicrobium sp.]